MGDLLLYYDDASPPCRSCLLLIKMLGVNVKYVFVDLFKGEQFRPDFLKLNPAHTVPVLQDGDLILTDSHAIMVYLCEKHGASELWPADLRERIVVTNMLFLESSLVFRRDSDFLSEIFQNGFAKTDFPKHEKKITQVYQILESTLANMTEAKHDESTPQPQSYMSGKHMTIADISLLTTCSTVDQLIPIGAEFPRLRQWLERMQQLPEYAINADGLARLQSKLDLMKDSGMMHQMK